MCTCAALSFIWHQVYNHTLCAHLLPQQVEVCLCLFSLVAAGKVLRHVGARIWEQCLGDKADGRHSALDVQHHRLRLLARVVPQLGLLAGRDPI